MKCKKADDRRGIIMIFVLIVSLVGQFHMYGQEDNYWPFGFHAGVQFNRGTISVVKTMIDSHEAGAAICDEDGQLLFYTDGYTIWDRTHQVMLNGSGLTGPFKNTGSTAQGAVIVPAPGNADQYYVFSLTEYAMTYDFSNLYYSIVDVSLNNGLGAVVPGKKALMIDKLLTEHMVAVQGNSCDAWLMVVSRMDRSFHAFHITGSGIDQNPVLSPGLAGYGSHRGVIGSIDISPARNKMAIAQGNLVLYDFDPDSGRISRPCILDDGRTNTDSLYNLLYYDLAFSPDNTRLYASVEGKALNQFDISSGDSGTMARSKFMVAQDYVYGVARAPDGKIYTTGYGREALNVVEQPDLAGTACGFVAGALPLSETTNSWFGLPDAMIRAMPGKVCRSRTDTVYCKGSALIQAGDTLGIHYVWEDGSPGAVRLITSAGTYWVRYQVPAGCIPDEYTDTFHIHFDDSRKEVAVTTLYTADCAADTFLLEAARTDGSDYLWTDGSQDRPRRVMQPGTYVLHYRIDSLCEDHTDYFIVVYPEEPYRVSFQAATWACQDIPLQCNNTSDAPFDHWEWFFGDQHKAESYSPLHIYKDPGQYTIMLTGSIKGKCADTSYREVTIDAPPESPVIEKSRPVVCAGEHMDFSTSQHATIMNFKWTFSDGRYQEGQAATVRHAYDEAGTRMVTLAAYPRACPVMFVRDTVLVSPLPQVDLGPDTTICLQAHPFLLRNRFTDPASADRYLWNTGLSTEHIWIREPGIYGLRVSNEQGCTGSAIVRIDKGCYIDIPNAFTPDGDGINDYFFPRQLLSQGVAQFHMQVQNRWGQVLFESTLPEGRGWDGRFNGIEQPAGVYIYRIILGVKGTLQERYEGNITLIR